ncbi:MAG: biopolymer transporter ExbD [Crocinitomicaceae bacterium]
MAKRELEEISAGSMADIAFLLLIFFLVTTTVEVDAGIGRNMPLKVDNLNPPEPVDIHDRDILEINANSNDQLLVEGRLTEFEDLEEIVRDYYTANMETETNPKMPAYTQVTIPLCQQKIGEIGAKLAATPDDVVIKSELDNWKAKLELCKTLPDQSYPEISKMAIIRLKNQAGTSYGLYIQIQNVLKKIVNELRIEYCEDVWGKDYFALKQDDPEDADIISKLRILVPERIIEAKIDR